MALAQDESIDLGEDDGLAARRVLAERAFSGEAAVRATLTVGIASAESVLREDSSSASDAGTLPT